MLHVIRLDEWRCEGIRSWRTSLWVWALSWCRATSGSQSCSHRRIRLITAMWRSVRRGEWWWKHGRLGSAGSIARTGGRRWCSCKRITALLRSIGVVSHAPAYESSLWLCLLFFWGGLSTSHEDPHWTEELEFCVRSNRSARWKTAIIISCWIVTTKEICNVVGVVVVVETWGEWRSSMVGRMDVNKRPRCR